MINNIYTTYDPVAKSLGALFLAVNDDVARRYVEQRREQMKKAYGITIKPEEDLIVCLAKYDNNAIINKRVEDGGVETIENPIMENAICYFVDNIPAGLKPEDNTDKELKQKERS